MALDDFLLTAFEKIGGLIPVRMNFSYEQSVRFTLGKEGPVIKKPGPVFFIPFVQSVESIDIRFDTMDIANISVESSDKVALTLGGVLGYRVSNARKCITRIGYIDDAKADLERSLRGIVSSVARKQTYDTIMARDDHTKERPVRQKQPKSRSGFFDFRGIRYQNPLDDRYFQPGTNQSYLEGEIVNQMREQTRGWGIKVYDFAFTDAVKTKALRLYGDTDTIFTGE